MKSLIRIHNPSIPSSTPVYISARNAERQIKKGRAFLRQDGTLQFAKRIVAATVKASLGCSESIDRDSAHIYVKDRWTFPHTQFAIDRAADHK